MEEARQQRRRAQSDWRRHRVPRREGETMAWGAGGRGSVRLRTPTRGIGGLGLEIGPLEGEVIALHRHRQLRPGGTEPNVGGIGQIADHPHQKHSRFDWGELA
jgi:hypothetical protein